MWDTLEVTHEGINEVKRARKHTLIQEYEMFRMLKGETTAKVQKRFTHIINNLMSLDKTFEKEELNIKILKCLNRAWQPKVTAISESKDLTSLSMAFVPTHPRALTKVKSQRQSQTYGGTHQGAPREEVNRLTSLGVTRRGRGQVWASPGAGVAMVGVARFRCRCCYPPIPTGRKDRGGDDTLRGHGTDEEPSGPGTPEL